MSNCKLVLANLSPFLDYMDYVSRFCRHVYYLKGSFDRYEKIRHLQLFFLIDLSFLLLHEVFNHQVLDF
jgi:hypothetical protein